MLFGITMFFVKLTGILLWMYMQLHGVQSECGTPGHSRHSRIKSLDSKRIFMEGDQVTYACPEVGSSFLIGQRQRVCKNGIWTGQFPMCASSYEPPLGYPWIVNISSKAMDLSFPTPVSVAGFKIVVHSTKKSIKVTHSTLTDITCEYETRDNRTVDSKNKYSITVHCYSVPPLTIVPRISSLRVTFSENVEDCSLGHCVGSSVVHTGLLNVLVITDDNPCGSPDLKPNQMVCSREIEPQRSLFRICCFTDTKLSSSNVVIACDHSFINKSNVNTVAFTNTTSLKCDLEKSHFVVGILLPLTVVAIAALVCLLGFLWIKSRRKDEGIEEGVDACEEFNYNTCGKELAFYENGKRRVPFNPYSEETAHYLEPIEEAEYEAYDEASEMDPNLYSTDLAEYAELRGNVKENNFDNDITKDVRKVI